MTSEQQELTILSTQLIQLNDDCFFEIFKWLPLEDLCSISLSCKRIRALAEYHFESVYKTKYVGIEQPEFGPRRIYITPEGQTYCRYFLGQIQNVELYLPVNQNIDRLIKFSAKHCSKNLKEIKFCNGVLNADHSFELRDILKKVETIHCYGSAFNGDIIKDLMKYCTNLKHFFYENDIPITTNALSSILKMQEMDSVYLKTILNLDDEEIEKKRRKHSNENIGRFKRLFLCVDGSSRKISDLLNFIAKHVANIDDLYISVKGEATKFEVIDPNIKDFLQCKVKRLHLEFLDRHFKPSDIPKFPPLSLLYGLNICLRTPSQITDFFFLISSLKNLRILRVHTLDNGKRGFERFYKLRHKYSTYGIEELFLGNCSINGNFRSKFISTFIERSPNLKKIIIYPNCFARMHKIQPIKEILSVAKSPITIYIKPGIPVERKNLGLITIKHLSDTEMYKIPRENPFILFGYSLIR